MRWSFCPLRDGNSFAGSSILGVSYRDEVRPFQMTECSRTSRIESTTEEKTGSIMCSGQRTAEQSRANVQLLELATLLDGPTGLEEPHRAFQERLADMRSSSHVICPAALMDGF